MQDSTQENTLRKLEEAEQLKLDGKYEVALEILEQLLVEDPQNVSALEEVADNELSLERYERASAAATRAVALDSQSYMGHYILGYLHCQYSRWEPAITELKEANTLQPNNPEILRCLGWALFSVGQRTQGIVTLERSLNLDPENSLTLCDLGAAYLKTHNVPKAKALLQHSLDLDPGNIRAFKCVQDAERMERQRRTSKQRVRQG
jgi:tetratricopeptide (TPR) repeat protein